MAFNLCPSSSLATCTFFWGSALSIHQGSQEAIALPSLPICLPWPPLHLPFGSSKLPTSLRYCCIRDPKSQFGFIFQDRCHALMLQPRDMTYVSQTSFWALILSLHYGMCSATCTQLLRSVWIYGCLFQWKFWSCLSWLNILWISMPLILCWVPAGFQVFVATLFSALTTDISFFTIFFTLSSCFLPWNTPTYLKLIWPLLESPN